ncbi:synaptotagmin-like protein 3 isoform X2 [Pleurodeles waltl]|uniref:synaptotagmin-like protein 3 isoform X2 n=1 Tax=Pleurodeles waltl TaxID=8319 RepID=UPI0037093972
MAQECSLNFLKETEREKVLDVLYRDQLVRRVEEERIRTLKMQLQQLRWKGAKNAGKEYKERSCARCQKSLGRMMNRGAVCEGCSHRVCSDCRVCFGLQIWKCTVCHAMGEVKVKTGDWFFEQRAKKFPSAGKQETAGATLLKSYQKLSMISVVPPTPPPFSETRRESNPMNLFQTKGFNKSMENMFLSLSTHMKKKSTSHNDMTDRFHLTAEYGQSAERRRERRSQSDTAISISSRIESSPHLLHLVNKAKEEEAYARRHTIQGGESTPLINNIFSGGVKHGSVCSISSSCSDGGNFDNAIATGEIELSIKFNFKTSNLEICVKACKNLAYGDEKKKRCNPYVKIYLLPDKSPQSKQKTNLKKNTVDPSFYEILKYNIDYCLLETRMLQISVWHAGTLRRNVFLGEVLIPLEAWNFEDNSTQSFSWYQLKAKRNTCEEVIEQYNGELEIQAKLLTPSQGGKIQYVDETSEGTERKSTAIGELHIVVHSAKNLPLRSDGTLSSFVKGCLMLPNKQELQVRCPVIKKQACPQWRHTFVFNDVSIADLEQSSLVLTVWDQASFGINDRFLGGVRLCTSDPSSMPDSCSQTNMFWQRILRRPNQWIEDTLTLTSNVRASKL